MMPRLSDEQRAAIRAQPGSVVFVEDAETAETYALVPQRVFQALRGLFDPREPIDVRDAYPLIEKTFAPGWDDPRLDVYNDEPEVRAP